MKQSDAATRQRSASSTPALRPSPRDVLVIRCRASARSIVSRRSSSASTTHKNTSAIRCSAFLRLAHRNSHWSHVGSTGGRWGGRNSRCSHSSARRRCSPTSR
jgi:hypothetical protein